MTVSITAGAIKASVELDTDPTYEKDIRARRDMGAGEATKDMKRSSLGMAAAKAKVSITMRYLRN